MRFCRDCGECGKKTIGHSKVGDKGEQIIIILIVQFLCYEI